MYKINMNNIVFESNNNDFTKYLDNIREFYIYKKKFENNKNNLKKKIIESNNSISEKKKMFSKLTFKCVNCGKPGGTLFNITNDKLIASCGNSNKPCELDINIDRLKINNIKYSIIELQNNIKNVKNEINLAKLDFLFKYKSEDVIVENFEKLKTDLQNYQEKYNALFEIYYTIVNNSDKNEELEKMINEHNIIVKEINELKNTFKNTNNIEYFKVALDKHINNVVGLDKKILQNKYKHNYVENDDTIKYLIQKKYNIDDLNYII